MLQRQTRDVEFQKMSFAIPKDLYQCLKKEAKKCGISMSLYIAEILREKRIALEEG